MSSPTKSGNRPPLLSVSGANSTFSSSSNPCSNASNSVLTTTANRFKNTFKGKTANSLFDKGPSKNGDNDRDAEGNKKDGSCKYDANNTKSSQDASPFKLFKSAKVGTINTENNQNITNDLAQNLSDNKSNNNDNNNINNHKSEDFFFVGKARRVSKVTVMSSKNIEENKSSNFNDNVSLSYPGDNNKNNNNQNNNKNNNRKNDYLNTNHDTDLNKDISIEKRSEWLALRVRRGSRTWPKLSLCFSGSIDM